MTWLDKVKCWWVHDWEYDGGKWILRNVSITTRKCKRCGLKQDIEHYHLIPNYTPGKPGTGIAVLKGERRPGEVLCVETDKTIEINELE